MTPNEAHCFRLGTYSLIITFCLPKVMSLSLWGGGNLALSLVSPKIRSVSPKTNCKAFVVCFLIFHTSQWVFCWCDCASILKVKGISLSLFDLTSPLIARINLCYAYVRLLQAMILTRHNQSLFFFNRIPGVGLAQARIELEQLQNVLFPFCICPL